MTATARPGIAALILLAALCGAGFAAAHDDPPKVISSDSIVRSLTASPALSTRGFQVEARASAGTPPQGGGGDAGKVNLDIGFGNDSNQLTGAAHQQLEQLGNALNSPALVHARFLVAGHTSATGNAAHNQALSEARARAVRSYLVEHFKIAPQRIEAQGFGSSRPLASYPPTALQQRRVEISTLP
jgi:OmpA-OmpF porin, OOP family